jgi:hypothetical protein
VSSATVFLALIAGYVVFVVLWQLTVSDSLYALAVLRARLRHRWPQWRHRVVLAFHRLRAATVLAASPHRRRYLAGALAGAAVAGLTAVAVVRVTDSGSKVPQAANPARLHPSRPLTPPATAAHSHTRRPTRVTGPTRHSRAQRATKVVSLVRVSAHVAPPARPTSSTQVARSTGPTPLPAPPGSSAPSPLAAP